MKEPPSGQREQSLRKRLLRREIPSGVRFVTFSCFRRKPLLNNPRIYAEFTRALQAAHRMGEFDLFAWVAMPEHVHLLLRPRNGAPLSRPLRRIKMSVAKRVLERWKQLDATILESVRAGRGSPRFWQAGGGFGRNVRNETEFSKNVCYIHRNPVERELVSSPADWKWSSVRWWMGRRENEVPCDHPPGPGWDEWQGFM